jgi:hypothetical protein
MSHVAVNPLRSIAADLGWAGHGGPAEWSYERLCDKAFEMYWRNRPQQPRLGVLCGTPDGFVAHGRGPVCEPCRRAEWVAVLDRRAAA